LIAGQLCHFQLTAGWSGFGGAFGLDRNSPNEHLSPNLDETRMRQAQQAPAEPMVLIDFIPGMARTRPVAATDCSRNEEITAIS
jgi:hypothetical protein